MGRQAIVTGDIDNVQSSGQVTVGGQEWSARSCDDNVRILEGTVVTVTAVSGVKLIVRPGGRPGGQQAAPETAVSSEGTALR